MDIDIANLSTKSSSLYDVSVNVLSDQQTFNMNHIYMILFLIIRGHNSQAIEIIEYHNKFPPFGDNQGLP